ncbi:MAG: hypothetical protein IJB69_02565 [Clostridia bacterium]|nr:hypothetical protein [Clostridia bacterium]
MGKIVLFPGAGLTLETALSINAEEYAKEELEGLLPLIENLYDEIQEEEPEDIESEEYYEWSELMEALDDLMDEIQDRLEE